MGRLEDGDVVVVDDALPRDSILDRGVRKLERDRVAGLQLVDVAERRAIRRPVPGDVDELVLARHVRLEVAAGTPAKVADARAVDDDEVQVESLDSDARDR